MGFISGNSFNHEERICLCASHYVEPTLYGEYKGGKTTTYNVVFVIILPVCSVYKAVSAQSGKSATFVFVFVRMARYLCHSILTFPVNCLCALT